jgi:hypothetical protein
MIANPDYDLARPLASALRAKAPYVGIPLPGHAPLIFRRDFLARALKGVRPVNIEVKTWESGARYLVIDGVADERPGSRVRHHMKMRAIPRAEFRGWQRNSPRAEMEKWKPTMAVSSAVAKAAAPACRVTKYDKAILKLEKQLAKLGARPKIANPAVTHGLDYDYEETTTMRKPQKSAPPPAPLRFKSGNNGAIRERYAAKWARLPAPICRPANSTPHCAPWACLACAPFQN